MVNDTDVKTDITNDNTNQILTNANSACTSTCTNVMSGNIIICDGCPGVDAPQTCDTTTQCIMVQQLDQQLENFMSAIANQDVKQTQGMFSFDFSETDLKTNIKNGFNNSLTQIMNTTCGTNTENIRTNNIIVVKDSTNGEPINLAQSGDVNSNCTINNLSKIVSKSDFDASSSQSLVQRNALVMIIVGIVAILIIAVLVVVVGVLGLGGLGVVGGATSGKGGGEKKDKSSTLKKAVELAALA